MRRRERAELFQVDRLGAADFRNALENRFRMNAETGPAYELIGEAKLADQLGDRRNERDDPIQRGRSRGLRGARAAMRS